MVADRIIFSTENEEQFMCDGNIGLRHLSKSTYILLVLAQWPHLVPKMTCIIIFLFFREESRCMNLVQSGLLGPFRWSSENTSNVLNTRMLEFYANWSRIPSI